MNIPDPQTLKSIVDCAGYSITGVAGVIGAWRRIRASAPTQEGPRAMSLERIERVEQDVTQLRERQDEMREDVTNRHGLILKQQTAMFDLLVQQRSVLDKILAKMGGLS